MQLIIQVTLSESVAKLESPNSEYLQRLAQSTVELLSSANKDGNDILDENIRYQYLMQINEELVSHYPKVEFEYHYFVIKEATSVKLHLLIDVLPDIPQLKTSLAKYTYGVYGAKSQRH